LHAGGEGDGDEDEKGACIICFSPIRGGGPHRPAGLRCGHVFGDSCIRTWLAGNGNKCPACNKRARLGHVTPLYHLPSILDGEPAAEVVRRWTDEIEGLKREKREMDAQLKRAKDELVAETRRHRREQEALREALASMHRAGAGAQSSAAQGAGGLQHRRQQQQQQQRWQQQQQHQHQHQHQQQHWQQQQQLRMPLCDVTMRLQQQQPLQQPLLQHGAQGALKLRDLSWQQQQLQQQQRQQQQQQQGEDLDEVELQELDKLVAVYEQQQQQQQLQQQQQHLPGLARPDSEAAASMLQGPSSASSTPRPPGSAGLGSGRAAPMLLSSAGPSSAGSTPRLLGSAGQGSGGAMPMLQGAVGPSSVGAAPRRPGSAGPGSGGCAPMLLGSAGPSSGGALPRLPASAGVPLGPSVPHPPPPSPSLMTATPTLRGTTGPSSGGVFPRLPGSVGVPPGPSVPHPPPPSPTLMTAPSTSAPPVAWPPQPFMSMSMPAPNLAPCHIASQATQPPGSAPLALHAAESPPFQTTNTPMSFPVRTARAPPPAQPPISCSAPAFFLVHAASALPIAPPHPAPMPSQPAHANHQAAAAANNHNSPGNRKSSGPNIPASGPPSCSFLSPRHASAPATLLAPGRQQLTATPPSSSFAECHATQQVAGALAVHDQQCRAPVQLLASQPQQQHQHQQQHHATQQPAGVPAAHDRQHRARTQLLASQQQQRQHYAVQQLASATAALDQQQHAPLQLLASQQQQQQQQQQQHHAPQQPASATAALDEQHHAPLQFLATQQQQQQHPATQQFTGATAAHHQPSQLPQTHAFATANTQSAWSSAHEQGPPLVQPLSLGDAARAESMGRPAQQLPQPPPQLVRRQRMSLNEGRCIALSAAKGVLVASDREQGRCCLRQMSLQCPEAPGRVVLPHTVSAIKDVTLSPHGNLVALATQASGLLLLSLSGHCVAEYRLGAAAWSCAWSQRTEHQVYVGLSNGTVSLVDLRNSSDRAVVESFNGPTAEAQRRPIHSLVSLPSSGVSTAGAGGIGFTYGTGDIEVLAATTAGVWGLGGNTAAAAAAEAAAQNLSSASTGEEAGSGHAHFRAERAGTTQNVGFSAPRPLCLQDQMGRRTCEGVAFNARTGAVAASWRSPYVVPSSIGATQSDGSNQWQPCHLVYDALRDQDLQGSPPSEQAHRYHFKDAANALTGHTSSAAMTRGCFVDIPTDAVDVCNRDSAGGRPAAGFWASGDEATRAPLLWCLRSGAVVAHLHSHPSHVLQLQADTWPATGQTFLAACSKGCVELYSTL
ncbi:hypothetical protein DUNSADRAFT_18315, partial [Dunaliella salina]